jgi:diguanylate cyclase (GGDEF)-like protein
MAFSKFRTKEDELLFSEEQSRTWIDHSPACTKIVDLDFNLQFMSHSGIQALAIDDITEYYGKPYPLEFYPEFFRHEMSKSLKKACVTGDIVIHEGSIVDLDGNELWFHSTISPVSEDGKGIDYLMVVSLDTTKQNIAKKELEELNNKLEDTIYRRTLELEEANKLLSKQSQTDFLTNLPNRLFFERRINDNVSTAKRNNQYLSLLMLDIDYFKKYNDNYGHDAGDVILQRVAKTINDSILRETDLVSRFGGEEFAIILPETNANIALSIAEKIRTNIELLEVKYDKTDIISNLTVSIGVSSLKGTELKRNDIVKQADIALYMAKDLGRNNCQMYKAKKSLS